MAGFHTVPCPERYGLAPSAQPGQGTGRAAGRQGSKAAVYATLVASLVMVVAIGGGSG